MKLIFMSSSPENDSNKKYLCNFLQLSLQDVKNVYYQLKVLKNHFLFIITAKNLFFHT